MLTSLPDSQQDPSVRGTSPEGAASNNQVTPEIKGPHTEVVNLAAQFSADWAALTWPLTRGGRAVRHELQENMTQNSRLALDATNQRVLRVLGAMYENDEIPADATEDEINAAAAYRRQAEQRMRVDTLQMQQAAEQDELDIRIQEANTPVDKDRQKQERLADEARTKAAWQARRAADPWAGGGLGVTQQQQPILRRPQEEGEVQLLLPRERFGEIQGLLRTVPEQKLIADGVVSQDEMDAYLQDRLARRQVQPRP